MHEIGHNLNLYHSGDAELLYGDQSGMMGFSYDSSDTPLMCFNPAKNFALEWFVGCQTTVSDPATKTRRSMIGHGEYSAGSCGADDAVVIRVATGDELDLYVGYNKQAGANSQTQEHANQVTAVMGNRLEPSTIVAALSPGQDYIHAATNGQILVKFCAVEGGKAVVGVGLSGQDPCFICTGSSDCQNGLFCDGEEVCTEGSCEPGDAVTCDNGVFCDGAEVCDEVSGGCAAGSVPCAAELCAEEEMVCYDCLQDSDCDDGLLCNGAEACVDKTCQAGTAVTCSNGVFCDGEERCREEAGGCVNGTAPCGSDRCSESEGGWCSCDRTEQCEDSVFCNGAEACTAGRCVEGTLPCVDATEECVEAEERCRPVGVGVGNVGPDDDEAGAAGVGRSGLVHVAACAVAAMQVLLRVR